MRCEKSRQEVPVKPMPIGGEGAWEKRNTDQCGSTLRRGWRGETPGPAELKPWRLTGFRTAVLVPVEHRRDQRQTVPRQVPAHAHIRQARGARQAIELVRPES